jgi:hypothetical protein
VVIQKSQQKYSPSHTIDSGLFKAIFDESKKMIFYEHNGSRLIYQIFDRFGPPYAGFEFYNLADYNVTKNNDYLTIEAIYNNGISITKEISINNNSFFKIDTYICNYGADRQFLQIKRSTNCLLNSFLTLINHKEGVFTSPVIWDEFPDERYEDISSNPDDYLYSWNAFYDRNKFIAYVYDSREVDWPNSTYLKKIRYGGNKMPDTYFSLSVEKDEKTKYSSEACFICDAVSVKDGISKFEQSGILPTPLYDKSYSINEGPIFVDAPKEISVKDNSSVVIPVKINTLRRKSETFLISVFLNNNLISSIERVTKDDVNQLTVELPMLDSGGLRPYSWTV